MERASNEGDANLAPINISDLESDMLQPFSPEGLRFTQHHVPFDFDGQNLVFMEYAERGIRDIKIFNVQ